jgi:hypothetical protein
VAEWDGRLIRESFLLPRGVDLGSFSSSSLGGSVCSGQEEICEGLSHSNCLPPISPESCWLPGKLQRGKTPPLTQSLSAEAFIKELSLTEKK